VLTFVILNDEVQVGIEAVHGQLRPSISAQKAESMALRGSPPPQLVAKVEYVVFVATAVCFGGAPRPAIAAPSHCRPAAHTVFRQQAHGSPISSIRWTAS